jgi:hypothetical protein
MQLASYSSAKACFPLEQYFLGKDYLLYAKHNIHNIRRVHANLFNQDPAYARYTTLLEPYLKERLQESEDVYVHPLGPIYEACYGILEAHPEDLGEAVAVVMMPAISIIAETLYPIESEESLKRELEEVKKLGDRETLKGEALKVKTAEVLLPLHKGAIFVANFADVFNANGLNLAPSSNNERATCFKQMGDIAAFLLNTCEKVFRISNPDLSG